MKSYIHKINSQIPTNEAQLQSLLSLKSFKDLFVPGQIYRSIEGKKWLHITQPDDLKFDQIPEAYDPDLDFLMFNLAAAPNLDFECQIYFEKSRRPGTLLHIKFSENAFDHGKLNYSKLKTLILDAKKVLDVEYSMVVDKAMYSPKMRELYPRFKYADSPSQPGYIQWMRYFSSDLVEFIGREKFEQMQTYEEKIETEDGGILLTLQREPFDFDNPTHREREARAIEELGLRQLAD